VDTKCPFSNVAIRELPKVAFVLQPKGITNLLVNIGDPEATVKSAYASDVSVVFDTGKVTQKRWNIQSVPTMVRWIRSARSPSGAGLTGLAS
jgi:hypothetical protein